jgi:sugar lactone lactonase YvrE
LFQVPDTITVSVPTSRPLEAAITPDGRELYVAINVDPPIDLPRSADGLAFMPDGLTAYVTDRSSREVRVIAVCP